MNYGRAIRVVRTARGLSQTELAERLSISASHLSLVEAGKREASVKVLTEIADALQAPFHLLTLLASRPEDLENPERGQEVAGLAHTLLKLLVSTDDQPSLPMAEPKRRKKSA